MNTNKSFTIAVIIVITLLVFLGFCLTNVYLFELIFSPSSDLSVYLAFFNLVVDIVVGVFTIWGLVWAAREFQASQEKANLDLVFLERERQHDMSEGVITAMSKNEITIDISKITRINNTGLNFLRVGLINYGSVIGLWYRIKIKSFSLYENTNTFWSFRCVAGTDDNWGGTNKSTGHYVFKSLGKEAIYPNDPMYLFAIPFNNNNRYKSECQIDYSIVTEQDRKEGVLTIRIIGV